MGSFFFNYIKITRSICFVIIFISFSTLHAKNFDRYNKAEYLADYFSGVLLLNASNYDVSYKYFKKLDGLEKSHPNFSIKYIFSLINSGKFKQALYFSKKIDRNKTGSFKSDLIIGAHYLKISRNDLAKKYFLKAKNRNFKSILDNYIINTLLIWADLKNNNFNNATENLNLLDDRFDNLKKVQEVFLSCYFTHEKTSLLFKNLISDKQTDFSRYSYFFAKYLDSVGEIDKAGQILKDYLKKHPRNLLLNQYKIDLNNSRKNFKFDCKNEKDVVSELFFIAANILSSQSIYPLSNFYLHLSKYLNEDFQAFDTLLAENFYKIEDYSNAKKVYNGLKKYGSAFEWYSNKQISRILVREDNKTEALNLMKKSYNELVLKDVYSTFDYAEFLKNNKEFKNSVEFYSKVLNQIDSNHPLFPEATDGRGVCYERIGNWNKAEKDFLSSLKASPDQAYVINYLAYSWIEKGMKIQKSLSMLEKADKLKSNDPYIIDSLGWALFKLERYEESKTYLQQAVKLMPADPIVNDHYGDVLWKNGKEIQARYYWNYVLNLEKTEKDLKKKIEQKLIKGL